MAASKNPYSKSINPDKAETDAYAVYFDEATGFTTYILKMYQSPEAAAKNPMARAFTKVTSPFTGKYGDLGDTYLSQIRGKLIKGTDLRGGRKVGDPLAGIL